MSGEARLGMGGNAPPLDQRLALEYGDLQSDVTRALAGLAAPTITTDDDAVAARDTVKPLKALQDRIERTRVEEKEPFLKAERAVDSFFKDMRAALDAMVGAITAAANAYQEKKRADARKAEAAEREAARVFEQPVPVAAAPRETVRVSAAAGVAVTGRVDWKYEVTDLSLVPRELLGISDAAVKAKVALLKATAKDIEKAAIPGIRIFEKIGTGWR